MLLSILAITGPIYCIIALGWLATRTGLFARVDMRVFGKFVLNFALPALLFNALSQRRFSEVFNASYVLAYLAGSLLVVALGLAWARRVQRRGATQAALLAMGMGCSNSGFVGYPILLLTLAPVAGVSLALNMLVENVLVIPFLLALAERGRGPGTQWHQALLQSLRRLATNPMIIGLALGFLVSLVEWQPPEPLRRTVSVLANASGALSLFAIGGTLAGLPLRRMGRAVAPAVIGKLLLHPLCVLLMALALPWVGLAPLPPELFAAALLMAAMPMMGIYPILAQAYGEEDTAAAALLLATIASFFTLSALLALLRVAA